MATKKTKPTPVKKTTGQKGSTAKKSAPVSNKKATPMPKKASVKAKEVKSPAKNKIAAPKAVAKSIAKPSSAKSKAISKKPVVVAVKKVSKPGMKKNVIKTVKQVKVSGAKAVKGSSGKKTALKLSKSKSIIKSNAKPVPAKKTMKAGNSNSGSKKLATMKKNEEKKPKETVNHKKTMSSGKAVTAKKAGTPVKKTVAEKPLKKAMAEKPVKKVVAQKPVMKAVSNEKKSSSEKVTESKSSSSLKMAKKEPKKAEKPFVMPKINTDKSREYKPAFTKSVLDQAPEEYNGPTMRYSDNELIEFRELIGKKVETAKKELGYLQGLITRKDQLGGDENENRYMTMEDGGLSMEREQLSQMASRQINFIDHLEKAMMRIENKTYGICRVTGKLIDKARLRAVPHATLSIEAKIGRANANV